MARDDAPGGPSGSPWYLEHLCDEAQADGVPCTERGRKCETCERAQHRPAPGAPAPRRRPPPPGTQADGCR